MPADLSPDAIRARKDAAAKGHAGGMTGGELRAAGIAHAQRAMKRRRQARRASGIRRRAKLEHQATEDLITAAAQLLIADRVPTNRPYLHHLSARDVARIEAGVKAQASTDVGTLAVDVHRRAKEAAARLGEEAPPDD